MWRIIRTLALSCLPALASVCLLSLIGCGGGSRRTSPPLPPALNLITVTPRESSIVIGTTQQFTATGTYSDGSTKNITSSVTWSSSVTSIVTINNAGLATAVLSGVAPDDTPGQTIITASSGSVNGSTTLTVTNNLISIVVSPSTQSFYVGGMRVFTATGMYEDGTNPDVTSLVSWSSSDTGVLTIVGTGSDAGMATAAGAGTATVTAAHAGRIAAATATVILPPPAIAASFFGMTIGDQALYPPSTVPIGAIGHPTLLAWATIEPDRGVYDFSFYDKFVNWAESNGISFMMTFAWTPSWAVADHSSCNGKICTAPPDNIQDWIDFVAAVIGHYNGVSAPHIKYYELWNEANDRIFWSGTSAKLVALAEAAYPIIHQDPNSLLLTPSTTNNLSSARTWMQQYLQAGGNQYADGGAFHGYLAPNGEFPYPFPEDSSPSGYGDIITRATTFRSIFDSNGLAGKPVLNTEGSWGRANITDPDQQVAWLTRWYLLQAGSGIVSSAYWFTWGESNPGGTPDQEWGLITNPDGTPTAAGIAYGQLYDWLVGASIFPCTKASNVWTCSLIRPGVYEGLIVWFYSSSESDTTNCVPDAKFRRYRDLDGNIADISGSVTIGAKPILLETGIP
jgi:hypothetical protein